MIGTPVIRRVGRGVSIISAIRCLPCGAPRRKGFRCGSRRGKIRGHGIGGVSAILTRLFSLWGLGNPSTTRIRRVKGFGRGVFQGVPHLLGQNLHGLLGQEHFRLEG